VVGLAGVAAACHLQHVEGELGLHVRRRLVLVGHLVSVLLVQLGVEKRHGAVDPQTVAPGVGGVVGQRPQREGVLIEVLRLLEHGGDEHVRPHVVHEVREELGAEGKVAHVLDDAAPVDVGRAADRSASDA
jgi:hypothetical protein